LVIGTTFFLINSIVIGNVWVDSVVFNCVLLLINLIFFLHDVWHRYGKIHLTDIEERVYENEFKKVLPRRLFRNLIRGAFLRSYSEGGQITHVGNNFDSIYFIALLNPNYSIQFYIDGKEHVKVSKKTWLGIVEYCLLEKERKKSGEPLVVVKDLWNERRKINEKRGSVGKSVKKPKTVWHIETIVRENEGEVFTVDPIYINNDEPVYIYEFPLSVRK
jgi:hypothetical protein